MNPEEARLILQCRRPHGQDDSLPAMSEAWQALDAYPDDISALKDDAALDAILGEKLRSLAPPADLRRNILTGAKVTPVLPWWRRRNSWLAAAALLVLGISWQQLALQPGSVSPGSGPPVPTQYLPTASLEDFRQDITAKVNDGSIHLGKVSPKVDDLQTWLASNAKGRQIPVPAGLAPLPTHGCEVFEWKGREVTLVCFEAADGHMAHLFTLNAADLPADLSQPLLASANGWQTLTWQQDGRLLVLTSQMPPDALRKLALPG